MEEQTAEQAKRKTLKDVIIQLENVVGKIEAKVFGEQPKIEKNASVPLTSQLDASISALEELLSKLNSIRKELELI